MAIEIRIVIDPFQSAGVPSYRMTKEEEEQIKREKKEQREREECARRYAIEKGLIRPKNESGKV